MAHISDWQNTPFIDDSALVPLEADFANAIVDTLTTQTPLNSGLVCAPQATVPEWPDGTATLLRVFGASTSYSGLTGEQGTSLSVASGKLVATKAAGAYAAMSTTLTAGQTIRFSVDKTNAAGMAFLYTTATEFLSVIDGGDKYIFYGVIPAGNNGLIYISTAAGPVYMSFIYIGDGTYTSKALDGSGLGNHATVYGATPVDTVAGRGFQGDGVNDGLLTFANATVISLSSWFKFTAPATTYYTLFGADNNTNNNNRVAVYVGGNMTGSYTDESIGVFVFNSSGVAVLHMYIRKGLDYYGDSLPHHLYIQLGGNNKVYVDGIEQTTYFVTGNSATNVSLAVPGQYMRFLRGLSDGFMNGTISDPRIYNRALSAEEVWELYSKPGMAKVSGPEHSATATPNSIMVRDVLGENKTIRMANGQGIDFSAGSEAAGSTSQLLSDYEEGTWTPILGGSTTEGVQTYAIQVGSYVKVGKKVFIEGYVSITAKGGTIAGAVAIKGIPFVPENITNKFGSISVSQYSGFTFQAGRTQLGLQTAPNSSNLICVEMGSNVAAANIAVANLAAASTIIFAGSYETA